MSKKVKKDKSTKANMQKKVNDKVITRAILNNKKQLQNSSIQKEDFMPRGQQLKATNKIDDKKLDKKKIELTAKQKKIVKSQQKLATEDLEIKALANYVKIAKKKIDDLKREVSKTVVGQEVAINHLIIGLLANGHVLVEGVPGIAKTLIVRSVATASGCAFGRIQFTPDLLPTDIIGVSIYTGDSSGKSIEKSFEILKGPVFNNFILADEINRAPPKVQSALLESMQEHQVTIGRRTLKLNEPFFVFATQNPIEQAGTYQLPEAQLDRFLFKIFVTYPKMTEEQQILNQNTTVRSFDFFKINPVLSAKDLMWMQELTRRIYLNEEIEKYIIRIVDATRYPEKYGLKDIKKYVDFGSSPRGSIGLFIGAKANAVINGRYFVLPEDVVEVAKPVLRHRISLTYEGQAEGLTSDIIIERIIEEVPAP